VPSQASADPSCAVESVVIETLGSGARVVVVPMPDAPLTCVDFWCRAGSAFEVPVESGMAHFLEHMVFKGSEQLAAGAFDQRIEALGGSSNAATGFDDVHYHVLIPPEALNEACDLLLELVLQPRLAVDDFELERQVVLEELAQSEDQPEEMALQTLLRLGCHSHPYGRAILGEESLLLRHTPAAMRGFAARRYCAESCVLAICGPLSQDEIPALVSRLEASPMGRLEAGSGSGPEPTMLELRPGEHRQTFKRLEAARILMAWSLPPARERHAMAALDLATSLLAEGRRSRLVDTLRERLRLVESIDLDLQMLEFGSLALLEAVCDAADVGEVRRRIDAELLAVQEHAPGDEELRRCHRLVSNGYRFGLEAASGVAAVIGNAALWGRPLDLDEPLHTLAALKPEDLRGGFNWLTPERAFVLEALPA